MGAEIDLLAHQIGQFRPLHLAVEQDVVRARQGLHPAGEARHEGARARLQPERLPGDGLDDGERVLDPVVELAQEQRAAVSSARFRSVTSRATFEAPTTTPALLRTGETVSETKTRRPSLPMRSVSKWSTRSPRRSRDRIVSSSARSSGGMMRMIDWPIISSGS